MSQIITLNHISETFDLQGPPLNVNLIQNNFAQKFFTLNGISYMGEKFKFHKKNFALHAEPP